MKKNKTQFGAGKNTEIPVIPLKGIHTHNITTRAGNTLQIFYNPENDLVVVDLIAKNEKGGNEILRQTLNEKRLLAHAK